MFLEVRSRGKAHCGVSLLDFRSTIMLASVGIRSEEQTKALNMVGSLLDWFACYSTRSSKYSRTIFYASTKRRR